jgi:hypothetical protein
MRTFSLGNSPTGVQHRVHVSDTEMITEEHTPTSVEEKVIDRCRRLERLGQSREARKADVKVVASVAVGLYTTWYKEWKQKYHDKWTWKTFVAMKLNSNDYSKLRIGCKRV